MCFVADLSTGGLTWAEGWGLSQAFLFFSSSLLNRLRSLCHDHNSDALPCNGQNG